MSILEEIVEQTRRDVVRRRERRPTAELERSLGVREPRFADALRRPGLSLIAEIKPRSPSRGALLPRERVATTVRAYDRYASAISVLCDGPYFGGGYDLLAEVRALTDVPLLAKDFVVDRYQLLEARAAGADAVLLMTSVLSDGALIELAAVAADLGLDALVETHDEHELSRALRLEAEIVGVNSRDLHTLRIDLERAVSLLASVPRDRIRVAESGLTDRSAVDRVRARADATLIGSALASAPDPAARIEELGWVAR